MTKLLLLKEQIVVLYAKHEVFITPIVKVILAFITIMMINNQLGYYALASNLTIVSVVALACSFLPYSFILYAATGFCLLHFYAMGMELLLLGGCGFALIYILFMQFITKESLVVVLLPILFLWKVPYMIPVAMGLIGTPFSIISVGCGIFVYYMIYHMQENMALLSTLGADALIQKVRIIIDALLDDRGMMVLFVSFTLTVLVVYTIRRLQIEYAWTVAMLSGYVLNIVVLLVGDLKFDTNISLFVIVLGSLGSLVVTKIMEFFLFNMDYSRTETTQFEDDEYYYYVKAVPKIAISTSKKTVKKMNTTKK
ncbi:MAG: hypothetical protein R3Y54_09325 [Eubacteriales bacterium]